MLALSDFETDVLRAVKERPAAVSEICRRMFPDEFKATRHRGTVGRILVDLLDRGLVRYRQGGYSRRTGGPDLCRKA